MHRHKIIPETVTGDLPNFNAFERTFFAIDMIQEVDGVLDDTVTDVTIITKGEKEITANQGTGADSQDTHEHKCFMFLSLSDLFNIHIV